MNKFYVEFSDHAYIIMVQIPNHPPREAWHNWFTDKVSAQKIAALLNNGTIKYIHQPCDYCNQPVHACNKPFGLGCTGCQNITNSYVNREKTNA